MSFLDKENHSSYINKVHGEYPVIGTSKKFQIKEEKCQPSYSKDFNCQKFAYSSVPHWSNPNLYNNDFYDEFRNRRTIKQELLHDISGNTYVVSPNLEHSKMDRKRKGSNSPLKGRKIKNELNNSMISIKQEAEDINSPGPADGKNRKRNAGCSTSLVKIKKEKSSTLSLENVGSNAKLKVKKRKSSITFDQKNNKYNAKYVASDDSPVPKKKKLCRTKNEGNVTLGTSREGPDVKFDLKTENDMKLLNKVFESDLRKKRQCFILSEVLKLSFDLTEKIMTLFDSDATIPFIARYRQHIVQNVTAEELRNFKHNYDYLNKVFDKAETLKKKIQTLGHLDETLSNAIDCCTTLQELDYIYEPYKVTKSSKLMKVIDSGLVAPATAILNGTGIINVEKLQVPQDMKENEIIELIIYYIGETMSKDTELLKRVQELKKYERIVLNCKQKKESTTKKDKEQKKKNNRSEDNYFNYYNFSQGISRIKPYQVLAINRGEKEQCLQVSIVFEDSFKQKLSRFAFGKWFNRGTYYETRKNIFNKAVDFMCNQRILPHLKRVIRSELTKEGEKASLEVFSSNLKYLLLTPPIHNVTVCAIDPGFSNGCKIAVLNGKQEVLTTDILYLNNAHHFVYNDCRLVKLMTDFNVDLVAVGNGKGCRDVESCLSKLFNNNFLHKNFKYIVINERGVSIYSCSPEAKEEYPNYSPNVVSAISLAKRVLDPLCEMVKVDPKHLGVGMYQHDISEKKLEAELDEVVSECVSNVGIDINNAPLRILKRVAGLTDSRAKAIIEAREKKGSFINRDELKSVKGIGPKTFQQCAGFIKIIPATIIVKKEEKSKLKTNKLDQTIIHPEDYNTAKKILTMNGLKPDDIGSTGLINKLTEFMRTQNLPLIAKDIGIPIETLRLILETLTKPIDYDIRSKLDKPIFRSGAKTINDLEQNTVLSGQVENVTHFGAFVDIGIECCGLIPTIFCHGKTLHLGQKVTVRVGEVDTRKMRVSLHLVKIDSSEE
ncbi:uncharacterized protein YdcI [Halyomorpha halys]|uniref:uncharacterized protein YdcI n=1 Tax=Halyomorpha halys TaxID=286706 RepID=UPI0006D511DF|nr:uncharacterized protein LOC106679055 [Halyomorpha halys]